MLDGILEIILFEKTVLLCISQLIASNLLQVSAVVDDTVVAAGSVCFVVRFIEVIGLHVVLHDQVCSYLLLDLSLPESRVGRIPNLAVVLKCCH